MFIGEYNTTEEDEFNHLHIHDILFITFSSLMLLLNIIRTIINYYKNRWI